MSKLLLSRYFQAQTELKYIIVQLYMVCQRNKGSYPQPPDRALAPTLGLVYLGIFLVILLYLQYTENGDYSPDNDNNCSSYGYYNCASGGSAIFYDTNGSTELLRAKGGHLATAKHTGGEGGKIDTSTDISSNSKILSSSKKDGESGGAGENGKAKDTSQTFKCDTTTYTATIGGDGGVGGYGGKAGNGGNTPGGVGGKGGSSILELSSAYRCGEKYSDNEGKGYLSEGGINGQFGSGGSGAGGIGGFSDKGGYLEDTDGDSLCIYKNSTCDPSGQGYAGGGGGGYLKAKVKVTGGQTYTIKLSHGGKIQGMTENKGTLWCYTRVKDKCFGGSYSGSGSGAYAKITAN